MIERNCFQRTVDYLIIKCKKICEVLTVLHTRLINLQVLGIISVLLLLVVVVNKLWGVGGEKKKMAAVRGRARRAHTTLNFQPNV